MFVLFITKSPWANWNFTVGSTFLHCENMHQTKNFFKHHNCSIHCKITIVIKTWLFIMTLALGSWLKLGPNKENGSKWSQGILWCKHIHKNIVWKQKEWSPNITKLWELKISKGFKILEYISRFWDETLSKFNPFLSIWKVLKNIIIKWCQIF